MMSLTWSMKSSLVRPNRSTEAWQAYRPAPVSAIISRNSGIGGMSSWPILRAMYWVITDDTPGRPPAQVARCRPGLPTVASLMCSWRALWMASRPKKVKKRFASMPSSEPLDTMMETFSILPFSVTASLLMSHRPSGSDAAAGLGDAGDLRGELGRSLGEELVQLLDAYSRGLAQRAHAGPGALFRVLVPHELHHPPVLLGQRADAALLGDLRRHLLAPLPRVGEETFVADGDLGARVDLDRHVNLLTSRRRAVRPAESSRPLC